MKRFAAVLLGACLILSAPQARAADDVVIGAIYPLTGNAAPIGADAKAAIETMLEIINGQHEKVPMLMGGGGGLDRLGGAKLRVVFADHQNDPQKARAEAERLITQEHVVALIGSYTSATAATISQVAERYEVPYLALDNSSPSLNKRGLKWFFRTSPHDEMFTAAMFDFFKDDRRQDRPPGEDGGPVLRGQHLRHRQQHGAAQAGREQRHQSGGRHQIPRQLALALGRGAASGRRPSRT